MNKPISLQRFHTTPVVTFEDSPTSPVTEDREPTQSKPTITTSRPSAQKVEESRLIARNDVVTGNLRRNIEAKLPDEGEPMTKQQFVDELGKKSMQADQKIAGIGDLAVCDLNTDGVISGADEWGEVFRQVDRRDSNGDGNTVDLTNAKVAETVDALRAAPGDAKAAKAAYSDVELGIMKQAMAGGPQADDAKPYSGKPPRDYLGRKISPRAMQVQMTWAVKEANLVYDPDSKRFYKQMNAGDPLVPLTAQELKYAQESLKANHPNEMLQPNEYYKRIFLGFFPKEIDKIDLESPT